MTAVLVDTHQVVTHLLARGFTQEQAEGVTEAIQEIDLSQLATKTDIGILKADIDRLEQRLEKEVERLSHKIDHSIEKLKADLFKWLLPLMLGQAGLIAALVKLL